LRGDGDQVLSLGAIAAEKATKFNGDDSAYATDSSSRSDAAHSAYTAGSADAAADSSAGQPEAAALANGPQ